MTKLIVIVMVVFISGCSAPPSGTYDLPVINKTNVLLVNCGKWNRISDKLIKATCLFDNKNKAEAGSLEIRAYDRNQALIGRTTIGKVTIGEKVRINKAMAVKMDDEPVMMTLEVTQ
ncbi:MAG: hypothetical protein HKP55_12660 [Gammaproteobacteria bacterium]|nr:hypothetical protein [Gammaproteobacteria bacterium]